MLTVIFQFNQYSGGSYSSSLKDRVNIEINYIRISNQLSNRYSLQTHNVHIVFVNIKKEKNSAAVSD